MSHAELSFATPRKLPKARELRGRVVVVDVAFASEASGGGYDKLTGPFIEALGTRLAAWVDHHDHAKHAIFAGDPRFVLSTKAEHGACPEMVTPELVARVGPIDTIVCHTDFDGLASAAKWIREGKEPYAGADDDARAIDTRIGKPSPIAERFDRAIRARPRDHGLLGLIVRHLSTGLADPSLWTTIDEAGAELVKIEETTRTLARKYVTVDVDPKKRDASVPETVRSVAFLDVTESTTAGQARYDKTMILMIGQERASVAALVDRDTLSLAAPFDSGVSFLSVLGLSGGMPTLVSVHRGRLVEALRKLGVSDADLSRLTPDTFA